MLELPILFFPKPTTVTRAKLGGGGGSYAKPSAAEQRRRLDARFRTIAESLHSVKSSIQGLEPEHVLVLETISESVEGLAKACEQIPGLEWLAEMDLDDVSPEAGFEDQKEPNGLLSCRLYAVMTNQQAMDQLISLWNAWWSNPAERARQNFGPFKKLFINLRELRRWNAEDRITETGVLQYLDERLQDGSEYIQFEVELWCRHSEQSRTIALQALTSLVSEQGGRCVAQAALREIYYHGVLVRMPAASVQKTVDEILQKKYGPLIRCEDVMFFRPFAQAGFRAEGTESGPAAKKKFKDLPQPSGEPIIAVLDGLPFENHSALSDRLIIDDTDGLSAKYSPSEQQHATAMTSLIIHGDLNRDSESPLQTPVVVLPILVPETDFSGRVHEVIPDDELLVDVIHRTVRRLFEGDSPTAPTVKLINLSIANGYQPFDREVSPIARLLDWLSWKYKVLFLVSVGNHVQEITLDASVANWRDLPPEETCKATLQALNDDQLLRRPFAPAEAINALTIGALHADDAPQASGRRVDLLAGRRIPSPIGTASLGHRRALKPEIYFPGGKQLFLQPMGAGNKNATFGIAEGSAPPGLLVAAPGQVPLDLGRTVHTRGTSNATALATRLGGKLYERLLELQSEPGGDRLDEAEYAVLLKCLLVHGSSWGEGAELLKSVFRKGIDAQFAPKRAWREMDRILYRFLGYGEVSPEISLFSTDERVTLIGWSEIGKDEGHVFEVPLPPALSGSSVLRRLTGTLAWLTPVNPEHRNYRQAALWFKFDEHQLGVSKAQVRSDTARSGTVEHRILEGSSVLAIDHREALHVTVSCKKDAGNFSTKIPYAIAISLEIAEPIGVSIYQEVRDRIRPRIEISPKSKQ